MNGAPLRCAVIVNPHAAAGGGRAQLAALSQVAAGRRTPIRVVMTDTRAALRRAAASFAAAGVELVGVCGGDGTVMATLTALCRAYGPAHVPRLLLLRGGTANTIASNLGLRGAPRDVLRRLLRLLDAGLVPAVRPWDTLRVQALGDPERERYGFLFAAAMGARFLEAYYQPPAGGLGRVFAGPGGSMLWAGALALRTAGSCLIGGAYAQRVFAETEVALEVDGAAVPQGRFRHIVAATVVDVGLGMRVAWQAGRQAGRFHLVASALPLWSMALQLPRTLTGAPLVGPGHVDRLAARARLRFPAPELYTLDGDLMRAAEIDLAAGPRLDLVVC